MYELGRNPTYWQPGKPGVDVLRVPLYRSNDEIVRALVANEVDWASLFFPDIEKDWVAEDPARHQYWYPDIGPTVLLLPQHAQQALRRRRGAQGPQHGPRPAADHARRR